MLTARRLATTLGAAVVAVIATLAFGAPAQALTVIATEYEHDNYGGAWISYYMGDGFVCSGSFDDVDVAEGTVPGNFNDKITSYQTFSVCWAKHWEHAWWSGAVYGWAPSTTNIGSAMNDRTSSLQWT